MGSEPIKRYVPFCPPAPPMPTNFHVREVVLVVLVSVVDDRLMERPLAPVPCSERPYKFTLASNGVLAHNQKSGDSIGEVRIVRRRAAVRDGSAG